MSSGFERLRVVAVAGVAGASLVPIVAGPAVAAAQNLPAAWTGNQTSVKTFGGLPGPPNFIFHRHTKVHINKSLGWPTGPANGYGISSIQRSTTTVCSTPTSVTTCGTRSTSGILRGPLVEVAGTVYTNPDGDIDVTSNRFTSDAVRIAGLRTQVRHDMLGMDKYGNSFVRVLVTMTNPGTKKLLRTIRMGSHVGSTAIRATSDGDQTYEQGDAWVITGNSPSSTAEFLAKGDRRLGGADLSPAGTGGIIDRYVLSFKPKTTTRLLYFVAISPPHHGVALASVEHHFDSGFALRFNNLTTGLSSTELRQIVNWTGLT